MMKKILVVDNNKVFLRLLSGYLKGKGYEVETAEDGLAALAVMENFLPEVVFVDLLMPLIDGERMCRIVRKMPVYDAVVLVVVTAVAAEAQIDFVSFGADACIAKGPFKGMQAKVVRVDTSKEEVTIEILEAAFSLPITVHADYVREVKRAN